MIKSILPPLEARVWLPWRELQATVDAALTRRAPGAAHDLEAALRTHKPDFISLLKKPVSEVFFVLI